MHQALARVSLLARADLGGRGACHGGSQPERFARWDTRPAVWERAVWDRRALPPCMRSAMEPQGWDETRAALRSQPWELAADC